MAGIGAPCYAQAMLRALLLLAALGALVAACAWVPLRGRTVLDRWNAASGVSDFTRRGVAEVRSALGLDPARSAAAASKTRPARPSRPAHPRETHTEADRAALDHIVAEHDRR